MDVAGRCSPRLAREQTGGVIASRPSVNRPVPDAARGVVGAASTTVVWENEVGGLTFEVIDATGRRFLKWFPAGCDIDPHAEIDRLRWAAQFVTVPRVLAEGGDSSGAWVLTAALSGENAVTDRWRSDPATAVRAIGRGLRDLHERLPVGDCPFSWSTESRLADITQRAAAGHLDPARWQEEHRGLGLDEALRRAFDAPTPDMLVVCHGDACAPNTLIADDGTCCGHVDLGSLGIADRWADLAVATWSTQWNYRTGWERTLLDAYGVAPDVERLAYYRLLWDLGP